MWAPLLFHYSNFILGARVIDVQLYEVEALVIELDVSERLQVDYYFVDGLNYHSSITL